MSPDISTHAPDMPTKQEDPTRGELQVVSGVLSQRPPTTEHAIQVQHNVLVPMRDGVRLAIDLIRPTAPGAFPVILQRTPYNKARYTSPPRPFLESLARRGYVVGVQDCRGRFNSDGNFDPYRQEHADGFDTIQWIASQSWCDGNVGMIGGSYEGQTQWFAACEAPEALKAIAPTTSPPGHPFVNEPFWGGALVMALPEWVAAMGRHSEMVQGVLFTQPRSYLDSLPVGQLAKTAGFDYSYWTEWLSHPTYDEFWRSCGYEHGWKDMKVPALNITGWWDMNFAGAPRNFVGMRQYGSTETARSGQRLVIGPWPHHVNTTRELDGIDFGPDAITDLNSYTLKFFDYWLKGEFNGLGDEPHVHVFVLGANQWWAADEWPLPGTQPTKLFLHSGGAANSHRGDGSVSFDSPGAETFDQYVSDPLDPVRAFWDLRGGPVDDRVVTARSDVLTYTSATFQQPMDLVGPVLGRIYASTSARDCDWHVRLVDVHPDQSARFLCHGLIRARFRKGYDKAVFLEPHKVELFEIDMYAVGIRILPGHRIRVEVASTWFPRFDRNPQTGVDNWLTDGRPPALAHQKVYHDAQHPSHIVVPLIVRPAK
jgi:putative CocE/NonD family hydrolase